MCLPRVAASVPRHVSDVTKAVIRAVLGAEASVRPMRASALTTGRSSATAWQMACKNDGARKSSSAGIDGGRRAW